MGRKGITIFIGLAFACLITGCQMGDSSSAKHTDKKESNLATTNSEEISTEEISTEELSSDNQNISNSSIKDCFLLMSVDSASETLRLYSYETGMEYQYYYSLNTVFKDRYKDLVSIAKFMPGEVVEIGSLDSNGRLMEMTMSDLVWEYDDVRRFTVEDSLGVFKIVDEKYKLLDNSFVFSNDAIVDAATITNSDKLDVIGYGKNILSIVITTGHGYLELSNTDLFEGSLMQLNTDRFISITPDMTLELPEGSYKLTVANDGWGGSSDITIKRDETTKMDLDTIKGQGPKYGNILFTCDVEGASISVDDSPIDYSEPISLKYGKHSIKVDANGFDEATKILFVNSPEATIMLSLKEEEADADTSSGTASTSTSADASASTTTGSTSTGTSSTGNSTGNTGSGTNSTDKTAATDDYLTDYLSTLTEMLGSL